MLLKIQFQIVIKKSYLNNSSESIHSSSLEFKNNLKRRILILFDYDVDKGSLREKNKIEGIDFVMQLTPRKY